MIFLFTFISIDIILCYFLLIYFRLFFRSILLSRRNFRKSGRMKKCKLMPLCKPFYTCQFYTRDSRNIIYYLTVHKVHLISCPSGQFDRQSMWIVVKEIAKCLMIIYWSLTKCIWHAYKCKLIHCYCFDYLSHKPTDSQKKNIAYEYLCKKKKVK